MRVWGEGSIDSSTKFNGGYGTAVVVPLIRPREVSAIPVLVYVRIQTHLPFNHINPQGPSMFGSRRRHVGKGVYVSSEPREPSFLAIYVCTLNIFVKVVVKELQSPEITEGRKCLVSDVHSQHTCGS